MPEIKAISANRLSFRIHYDSISSEVTGHSVGAIARCSIIIYQIGKTLVEV